HHAYLHSFPTRRSSDLTEVVIHFKSPHHQVFKNSDLQNKDNQLIIRIQPDEGILIKFGVKVPGQGFKVERANLDFYYSSLAENKDRKSTRLNSSHVKIS